jgi:hypothetical protein
MIIRKFTFTVKYRIVVLDDVVVVVVAVAVAVDISGTHD